MDSVSIVDERGNTLVRGATFVRAPAVGEWVWVGAAWVQVVGVAHGRANAGPVLTIQVDVRTRPNALANQLLTNAPAEE
jgi:hypothetical protein